MVHSTTRQTLEIPHIKKDFLKKLGKALEKNGTPIGSEKDEIVNIIACPGTERCKFANIDTIGLAKLIDTKLFGKAIPVKMRIALSGCPNGCTSPMLNEIGVIGRVKPGPHNGAHLHRLWQLRPLLQGKCDQDKERHIGAGRRARASNAESASSRAHFDLVKAENRHYLITVGGRRGRHPKIGRNCSRWSPRTRCSL